MPPTPRYVFDTNVLVSALIFVQSAPARALHLGRRGTVLLSLETLDEVTRVLCRPKFDAYVTLQDREQFLAKVTLAAELVAVHERVTSCRDPKDNKFLEVAVNGAASAIITGDADLLVLHPLPHDPHPHPTAVRRPTPLGARRSLHPWGRCYHAVAKERVAE